MTREIPLVKVIRLWNGPSFRGYKPIQVVFDVKDQNLYISSPYFAVKSLNVQNSLPKSNLGELSAVERQRGGVEEKQPSAEKHEHVRFGRFWAILLLTLIHEHVRFGRFCCNTM